MLKVAGFVRSNSGNLLQMLYSVIFPVHSTILSVIFSGAGPPFSQLYLIPKSLSGPPGLCDAEHIKPPNGLKPPSRHRITADVAGVDRRPLLPHQMRPTPFASAILMMIWIASGFQYRPSPETTSVPPST